MSRRVGKQLAGKDVLGGGRHIVVRLQMRFAENSYHVDEARLRGGPFRVAHGAPRPKFQFTTRRSFGAHASICADAIASAFRGSWRDSGFAPCLVQTSKIVLRFHVKSSRVVATLFRFRVDAAPKASGPKPARPIDRAIDNLIVWQKRKDVEEGKTGERRKTRKLMGFRAADFL
jgi:hypothetical protein